jgi:hypothetical protein
MHIVEDTVCGTAKFTTKERSAKVKSHNDVLLLESKTPTKVYFPDQQGIFIFAMLTKKAKLCAYLTMFSPTNPHRYEPR